MGTGTRLKSPRPEHGTGPQIWTFTEPHCAYTR